MARIDLVRIAAVTVAALWLGCSEPAEESAAASAPSPGETSVSSQPTASPELAAVNDSLKTGAFDDAAARLLEMQAPGRNFTPREAADYRQALNEAYTRALEAADKGDARAEAAIRMIRAANSR